VYVAVLARLAVGSRRDIRGTSMSSVLMSPAPGWCTSRLPCVQTGDGVLEHPCQPRAVRRLERRLDSNRRTSRGGLRVNDLGLKIPPVPSTVGGAKLDTFRSASRSVVFVNHANEASGGRSLIRNANQCVRKPTYSGCGGLTEHAWYH